MDRAYSTYRCKCGCGLTVAEHAERLIEDYRQQWEQEYPAIPFGTCLCGCGRETRLAPRTSNQNGHVKGAPLHYFERHDIAKSVDRYKVEDLGYKTPCWVWLRGTRPSNGGEYGTLWRDGKRHMAHRYYYEQKHGKMPEGYQPHHLCVEAGVGTTLCCNPDHIEPVSSAENTQRGHLASLTAEQVIDVHRALKNGARQIDLARYYGVTPTTINFIAKGRTWKQYFDYT